MPARSSPRHFDEMMNHLEAIKPGRTTNLGATLHRLADRFKRRCLIVLISDLYDDPEAVDRALHHFRHKRHEVIVFHVLDRAEIEFPFRETASFVDMETGERIQVDPAYVRDDYRRQLDGVHRPLPADLRGLPVRLRADRHLGSLRSHALALPGETDPAMTFAAPLFLLAALAGLIPVVRAPDPPPEGQGGPVQHAPVPPDQRAADPAAEVHRGHVAPGSCGSGVLLLDRRRAWPGPRSRAWSSLWGGGRPRRSRSCSTTRPAWP